MTACNRKIAERKHFTLFVALMAGLVMILALLSVMSNAAPSSAAPEAAPTPLSNPVHSEDAINVEWASARVLTEDTYLDAKQLINYETLDVSYTLDKTVTNTCTVTVQFSNDGTNWASGINIATNVGSEDATDLLQINNFGRYTRFKIDLANTNPITWTILAVAK